MTLKEEEKQLRSHVEISERSLIFWFKKVRQLVDTVEKLESSGIDSVDSDYAEQIKKGLSLALAKLDYELEHSEKVEKQLNQFISRVKNR